MAKLVKKVKSKKAPVVEFNAEVVKEEVAPEEVKEVVKKVVEGVILSPEDKFKAGLLRVIEAKVTAGQGRFLGLEEILPIFRSSI